MPDEARKEPEPPFLNTVEAAAWLRLTKNTLEKCGCRAGGRSTASMDVTSAITSKTSSTIPRRASGARRPMRIDPARLRLQMAVLAAISAANVAMLIGFDVHTPLVVYNASGSAPLGFYRLENRLPRRGEMAIIKPPPAVELMLIASQILPPSVPLVKQVAAIGGDDVCRSDQPNGTVSINGKVVVETFDKDRDGRPLPVWSGWDCVAKLAPNTKNRLDHSRSAGNVN